MRGSILAVLMLLVSAGDALAEPDVAIDGAWCIASRARPGTAYVYLTMTLHDEQSDTLVAAATDVAALVQILAPSMVRGRAVLHPVSTVSLDASVPTVFQPEDTHIVLVGLKRNLNPGDSFAMTLDFIGAGRQEVTVNVLRQPPSAGMPELPKGVKME
jgi:copper(I)-binding protein